MVAARKGLLKVVRRLAILDELRAMRLRSRLVVSLEPTSQTVQRTKPRCRPDSG